MRTSLLDIEQAEAFLTGRMEPGEALVYRARLLADPVLKSDVALQAELYEWIRLYGRKQLRQEIEAVHRELFRKPEHASFRDKIRRLFKKP